MIRIVVLVAALLVGLGAVPALAQDRAELALQAVDAAYLPQVETRMMDTLWPATEKLIREKLPNTDDARMAEFRTTVQGFARESAQYALLPMGVALARNFNEDELRQLIAFYSSPVGMKLNGATSEITTVFANDVSKRVNEQVSAFQNRVEEMIASEAAK